MKWIKPSDLRREAEAMIRDGAMPTLAILLDAIAETRAKYSEDIQSAKRRRKQPRNEAVADSNQVVSKAARLIK